MADLVGGGDFYPGQDLSVSQLLYAAKRKMCDATVGGSRIMTTLDQDEINVLEREALEVLRIVRAAKNSFAPINRIPPEILSLIPDHCETDNQLVTLTHVCRRWRAIFISCPWLWTSLECTDLDQTRIYLERSEASPLDIWFKMSSIHAFLLTLPHIGRLRTLALSGRTSCIRKLTQYLVSPAPLLENLEIHVRGSRSTTIGNTLFDGDLPSLRELRLSRVITDLPWNNLSKLKTFFFRPPSDYKISVTRLLDFFEHAPLLRELKLTGPLPDSSDAPVQRVVSLPRLRLLRIATETPHSIILNHLHIPTGVSANLEFQYDRERSPFSGYLPRRPENLGNVSHITSVNLNFDPTTALRFEGPSGGLYVVGARDFEGPAAAALEDQTFQVLNMFRLLTTARLAIAKYSTSIYSKTNRPVIFQTFLAMKNLRALTLTHCFNLPFISALDPNQNATNAVVCPKLEVLTLFTEEETYFEELLEMAKGRASMGVTLSLVTITCPREFAPAAERVSELRRYALRVGCGSDGAAPAWYTIDPDEVDETDYPRGWWFD